MQEEFLTSYFQVNLKRFQCIDHPYEISKLHYCHMETLRNGSQVLGVILEFLNSLQKVNVAGGLYIQYFRTRTPLLATTMEYCQQNKDILSIKNPVNKFALDYAQKHLPQLLTDCPIRKGKVFNITGLLVDDRLIPSFVMSGTYYVEFRAYNKRNQTAFSAWLEADIK
ncbi:AGAP013151-PA [Anopheles gambiae str. PEST]|uniref:AGAP013151-PA n=2 Tax=gambiae species complex TaxID=44542 RepID=F5HIU8_ANOGA|nr:AGAP013151-PA [Anopheles gambiae str. PEST]